MKKLHFNLTVREGLENVLDFVQRSQICLEIFYIFSTTYVTDLR